jgi:hypothetical protein
MWPDFGGWVVQEVVQRLPMPTSVYRESRAPYRSSVFSGQSVHVYLDQNKWVDLARAMTGHAGGARFRDILEIARHGSKAGFARFPLSPLHYLETLSTGSSRRRHDVGTVMNELSHGVTMASSDQLLPGEIDRALRMRWGIPKNLRERPVFGDGASFAFGEKPYRFPVPAALEVDEMTRNMIVEHYSKFMNEAILAPPIDIAVPRISESRELGDRHAREERELGELIRGGGYKGERFREVWLGRFIMELSESHRRGDAESRPQPAALSSTRARRHGGFSGGPAHCLVRVRDPIPAPPQSAAEVD